MTIAEPLLTVLVVEIGGLLLAFSVVIAHAVLQARADRILEQRLRTGREFVLAALERPIDDAIVGALRPLGHRTHIRLLAELAPALEGAQRASLGELAVRLGLQERAERRCLSRLWWWRLYATRVLTLIDGGAESMPRMIRDPHQLVRTQVAEWATLHPTPAILGAIVALLDDPRRIARFAVQDTLLRIGQPAIAVVIGSVGGMSGLGIAGGLLVAARLGGGELLPFALAFVAHPDSAARAGAARVLGATRGEAASAVLRPLLDDPVAEVRQAAVQALGRLGHWASAVHILPLLGDPTWPVRRETAVALLAMGAPGALILRTALRGPDRFAADMAAQALRTQEAG